MYLGLNPRFVLVRPVAGPRHGRPSRPLYDLLKRRGGMAVRPFGRRSSAGMKQVFTRTARPPAATRRATRGAFHRRLPRCRPSPPGAWKTLAPASGACPPLFARQACRRVPGSTPRGGRNRVFRVWRPLKVGPVGEPACALAARATLNGAVLKTPWSCVGAALAGTI